VIAALASACFAGGRRSAYRFAVALGVGLLLVIACVVVTPVTFDALIPTEYASALTGPTSFESGGYLPAITGRVGAGLREYTTEHLAELFLSSGRGGWIQRLAAAVRLPLLPDAVEIDLAAAIAVGFARWWRDGRCSTPLVTLALYVGLLLVWPWRNVRLLYPVVPHLTLAFLLGVGSIQEGVRRWMGSTRTLPRPVAALAIVMMTAATIRSLRIPDTRSHVGDLRRPTEWLRSHSPATAILLSEHPQTDYLYGGRKTVPFPASTTPDGLAEVLERRHVDYVLVSPDLRWDRVHVPAPSARAELVAASMNELVAQGRARLVHPGDADGVSVFEVVR